MTLDTTSKIWEALIRIGALTQSQGNVAVGSLQSLLFEATNRVAPNQKRNKTTHVFLLLTVGANSPAAESPTFLSNHDGWFHNPNGHGPSASPPPPTKRKQTTPLYMAFPYIQLRWGGG